mmetsp:Transcript_6669/g.15692  ORF Transcript_6669/g.15692 Transcript_6669/m.15692 type:complete len:1151 (+) Transcript_6669:366-3818(+)
MSSGEQPNDAWSMAMSDESNSRLDPRFDDLTDESKLNLLIARVDQMDKRAQRSEKEMQARIAELWKRLLESERSNKSSSKLNAPWRKIGNVTKKSSLESVERGGCEEEGFEPGKECQLPRDAYSITRRSSLESVEHGGCEEEGFEPGEEYQLPRDAYSILGCWKSNSRPFWIALLVISVQIAFLLLLLTDQIGSTGESDLVVVPVNVPRIVHASQALATIVAIFDQDDLRSAIEGYFDGLPTRFRGDMAFQRMNKPQWNFCCGIRFVQGFLSVFASFVLAVQSETVFDVLLNFLGVKFVSELDDLAFNLCQLGYFGVQPQRASKCIVEAQFQQDDRNKADENTWNRSWFRKYAHVIGVFGILAFLLGLFFFVLISQNSGDFSAQEISMTLAEGSVPFAALFSGCYRSSRTGKMFVRRVAYEQMGFEDDGGLLGFCGDVDGEKAWTFTFNSVDPCKNIYARTEATTTFNILELGNSQWYSMEGVSLGNTQISRVLDSSAECGKTISDDANDKLCEQLDVQGFVDGNQQGLRSTSFYKMKVNSTGATVFTNQALRHPIYVGSSSTPTQYELILFTGQCWVLTRTITAKIDSNLSMQDYMNEDAAFLSTLEMIVKTGYHVELVSSSVTAAKGFPTPLGRLWYHMQNPKKPEFNYPAADLSRPQEMNLRCAKCGNITNPCYYGGICREDKICDCVNGGGGALCQEVPIRDGRCDPYFNTEQYDWDGGDCCGGTCIGHQCGLAGGLSSPFGINSNSSTVEDYQASNMGYGNCVDPSMAPLTIELNSFELFDDEYWISILTHGSDDPFCSTATINVRCNGITYIHAPQNVLFNTSDCHLAYTETVHVPYGSECELSTNIPCFGIFCIGHTVTVYYGKDTESTPIRSGNVKNESQLSFGVPLECLTDVLLNYSSSIFDLSTHQGKAASALSNDGLSGFLCFENSDLVLERYALAVLNASVHFKSSNWGRASNCHGFGAPAVRTTCTNDTITSLVLGIDVVDQLGTIPTELALLSNLDHLALRMNVFEGSIPSELGLFPRLASMELWECGLSGTIPTELGSISNLSALALATNGLTGTIPTELGRLKLMGLWLSENQLTGPIPSELGTLESSLVTLDLNNNTLSGEIPSELLALSALRSCTLGTNNFTGGLAPAICTV